MTGFWILSKNGGIIDQKKIGVEIQDSFFVNTVKESVLVCIIM